MNTDYITGSDWLVYVLDPEHKDAHGWTKPLRAFAHGADKAIERAAGHLPDGSYLLFVVCCDDNEARHARITIDRRPAVTVKLV